MVALGLFNWFSDEANVSHSFRTQGESRDFILMIADEMNRSVANFENVAERRGQRFFGSVPVSKK